MPMTVDTGAHHLQMPDISDAAAHHQLEIYTAQHPPHHDHPFKEPFFPPF